MRRVESKQQAGIITEDWNGTGARVYTSLPKKNEMMSTGFLRMKVYESCVRRVFSLNRGEDKHLLTFDEDEWERLRELPHEFAMVVQGAQFKQRGDFHRG
jgi:hypothetical protein